MLLPIGIRETDTIAGNYGPAFAEASLLNAVKEADSQEYGGSEEYRLHDENEEIASGRYLLFGIYTPSHTCADYERVLKYGLKDYERRIDRRLQQPLDEYGKIIPACDEKNQYRLSGSMKTDIFVWRRNSCVGQRAVKGSISWNG